MPTFSNDPVISTANSQTTPAVQGEGSGYEGIRGISHNAHGGVVGINDWSPTGPKGAGGNGGWFESTQGEGVRGWAKSAEHGGVVGVNTAGGIGVYGQSDDGIGTVGESQNNEGVRGISHNPHHGGVVGVSDQSNGVGVFGTCDDGKGGVVGTGVWGKSRYWGVLGESQDFEGVRGISHNPNHGGVVGICDKPNGIGVFGFCDDGSGSLTGTGVWGKSSQGEGLHGETTSTSFAAVAGIALNPSGTGAGVYGESRGLGPAGFFKGDVQVTGDIKLLGADCAEDFDIACMEQVEPGTVMVIDSEGSLRPSAHPYDKRVAGVIAGAMSYRPGIRLDKHESNANRMPIALLGKVYCKVDARYGSIQIGDLLTSSPTPGHAMKAANPRQSFGAVIGKALRPLRDVQGLIPILVALQ